MLHSYLHRRGRCVQCIHLPRVPCHAGAGTGGVTHAGSLRNWTVSSQNVPLSKSPILKTSRVKMSPFWSKTSWSVKRPKSKRTDVNEL